MAEVLGGQSGITIDQADIESNWTETVESFDALGLNEDLLRGIYAYGFEKPSAIQQKGILPLIRGRDTICQAQSGTGKTATFAIGALQRIDVKSSACQALLLAPTRELALQIQKVVIQLGDFMQAQCHACIGGANMREDIRTLQEGFHVVVGTPGRIYDMIDRRALRVTDIKMFVLDEADEMLSRGFKDHIYDVFKFMSHKVQVCVFSATMPGELLDITKRFMHEPVRLDGCYRQQPLTDVRQFYCVADSDMGKLDTLHSLKDAISTRHTIIYVSNRLKVDWLFDEMVSMGCSVGRVHEDMPRELCDDAMREFRRGATRVVVASLAHRVDTQVSLVIHYDLPSNSGRYFQSIDRTGLFGRRGVAINLITVDDLPALKQLEVFGASIQEMPANVADLI